jgi:hypothetical protein
MAIFHYTAKWARLFCSIVKNRRKNKVWYSAVNIENEKWHRGCHFAMPTLIDYKARIRTIFLYFVLNYKTKEGMLIALHLLKC